MNLRDLANTTYELHWAGTKNEDNAVKNTKDFLEFIGGSVSSEVIGTKDIMEFIGHLKKSGLSNGTINRKLAAVSKIMKTGADYGVNGPLKIQYLKEAEPKDRVMTTDEYFRIRNHFYSKNLFFCEAVTVLLWYTGMRRGEIWNFTVSYQADGLYLKISNTKGNKPRTLKLSEDMFNIVERVCAHRGDYSAKHFSNKLDDACRDNGIQGVSAHTFRHTFATRAAKILSIHELKEWMGHSSIKTTERYMHPSAEYKTRLVEALESGKI